MTPSVAQMMEEVRMGSLVLHRTDPSSCLSAGRSAPLAVASPGHKKVFLLPVDNRGGVICKRNHLQSDRNRFARFYPILT